MYAEDLTFWDQALIVATVMALFIGSFILGGVVKEHDLAEEEKQRDIENAAHRAATLEAKRDRLDTWA